jgi:hypothetical protein
MFPGLGRRTFEFEEQFPASVSFSFFHGVEFATVVFYVMGLPIFRYLAVVSKK